MKMRMRALVLALIFVLGQASEVWAWATRTKSVHDGDSINVLSPDNVLVNIRLYGVDAPELKQAFGYQARKRLVKLAARQELDIEPVDTDRYGRTVALVRLKDGTLLNEVMVTEGLAWVYDEYCHREICLHLQELQERARQERRGLWAGSNPERPADWRKAHKTEEWYKAPVRAVKAIARKIKVVLRN